MPPRKCASFTFSMITLNRALRALHTASLDGLCACGRSRPLAGRAARKRCTATASLPTCGGHGQWRPFTPHVSAPRIARLVFKMSQPALFPPPRRPQSAGTRVGGCIRAPTHAGWRVGAPRGWEKRGWDILKTRCSLKAANRFVCFSRVCSRCALPLTRSLTHTAPSHYEINHPKP